MKAMNKKTHFTKNYCNSSEFDSYSGTHTYCLVPDYAELKETYTCLDIYVYIAYT